MVTLSFQANQEATPEKNIVVNFCYEAWLSLLTRAYTAWVILTDVYSYTSVSFYLWSKICDTQYITQLITREVLNRALNFSQFVSM